MRGDLNWIDVEIEIEHLHNAINEFIISCLRPNNIGNFDYKVDPDCVDQLFDNRLNGKFIRMFISNIFSQLDINIFRTIGISKNEYENFVKCILLDYDKLVAELQNYLKCKEEELEVECDQNLNSYLENVCYFVNFNYTTLAERNYGARLSRYWVVIHPHGKVEDKIVLGIPVDRTAFIFQKISKEIQIVSKDLVITRDVWNKIDYPEFSEMNDYGIHLKPFTIAIMGHSLGQTDWYTLTKFFAPKKEEFFGKINLEVIIFYHDIESKQNLIHNVFLMIGKDLAQKHIKSGVIKFVDYKQLAVI